MNHIRNAILAMAGAVALMLLYCAPARSACAASYPFTIMPYTLADANQVMSNFTYVQTCVFNVDNTQIGSAGIFPSQIKPTTSTNAIFGTGLNTQGMFFGPYTTALGIVPLTVAAPSGQTADIFDVTLNAGLVFQVLNNGATQSSTYACTVSSSTCFTAAGGVQDNGPLFFGHSSTTTFSSALVGIQNDGGVTNGMVFNVPSGSTNGYQFQVNGITKVQATTVNLLAGTTNGTPGAVPPVYAQSGSPVTTGTMHAALGTFSSTLSVNCLANTTCTVTGGTTVTFSGAGVGAWTSAASYACMVSPNNAAILFQTYVEGQTTSSFAIGFINESGVTQNNGTTVTASWYCVGT